MTADRDLRILGLIVARAGSKGVPGKNLQEIGGLSLIGYKARSARGLCSRLVISTDSEAMQAEARRHGVECPFLRPAELASDTAQAVDVVRHAIEWFEREEGVSYDAILLLEPASPFARAADYAAAIALYRARRATLVVGVRQVSTPSLFVAPIGADGSIATIVDRIVNMSALRRQDFRSEVTMNGSLYLFDWQTFKRTGKIYGDPPNSYGLVMDDLHSVSIDRPIDLHMARFLVDQKLIDVGEWPA